MFANKTRRRSSGINHVKYADFILYSLSFLFSGKQDFVSILELETATSFKYVAAKHYRIHDQTARIKRRNK